MAKVMKQTVLVFTSFFMMLTFSFVGVQTVIAQDSPTDSALLFEEKRFWMHDTHDFYNVTVVSNSTVSDFYFLYALMRISFYVNGTAGTTGLCNVTIPSEFMSTEFSIFKDEMPLIKNTDYTETFNGTHYLFTIIYHHSIHLIQIYANNNIPEFPSTTILPLFLISTLCVIVFRKKLFNRS